MFALANLLSANAQVREHAEAEFKAMQSKQPLEVCKSLLLVNESRDLINLALVLLRQTLKLGWENNADKLQIAEALLQKITKQNDGDEFVERKQIEALVALPRELLVGFTPAVLQFAAHAPAPTRALLLLMDGFAEFAFSPQIVAPFVQLYLLWLGNKLMHSSHLFKAAVSLLVSCEEEEDGVDKQQVQALGHALPMQMLQFAIDKQDSVTLEALCALAEPCAWTLDYNLKEISPALLGCSENKANRAEIRSLSMAVFGSIVARKANSMCKDAEFCTRIVHCLLVLQGDDVEALEDLFEGGEGVVDEGDVLSTSQVGLRGSALDCARALAFGSSRITADSRQLLGIVLQEIQPLLASPNWMLKLAGLCTMAVMGAHFPKPVFRPMLKQVVQGSMGMTANAQEHVKVRFAACATVLSLLQDEDEEDAAAWRFAEMRTNLHQDIVPMLGACLQQQAAPSELIQVWLMTLCAFYGSAIDDKEEEEKAPVAIALYLDGLVQLLVQLMQRCSESEERVLCLTMDALACIGAQGKQAFAKFYAELVPMIKICLGNTKSSSIKKSAMLLVASCAEAVGKDQFARDGLEIVNWFFNQQQLSGGGKTNLDETNEVEGLFLFCERLVQVLQHDFAVFTPHIMPLVVQALQADLGLSITNNGAAVVVDEGFEEDSGQARIALPVRGVSGGPVEISANVYAFQIRYKALALLECLAEGDCVDPALVQELLVNCVVPNIADRMCTLSLNAQASSTAAALFAVHQTEPLLVQLCTQLLTGLAFDDPERNMAYATALDQVLQTCVEKQTCRIPAKLFANVFPLLLTSFSSSVQRRLDNGEDDEDEEEVELCQVLVDCLGNLLKSNPDEAAPVYGKLVLEYMNGLINARDDSLRLFALCCFIDYVEFAPTTALATDSAVVAVLLQHLKYAIVDPNSARLRQVGAYGTGILALRLPANGQWCNEYKILLRFEREVEDMDVRDNMISALAKLCVNQGYRADWQQEFISQLPLKEDMSESKYCINLVFDLVLSNKLVPGAESKAAQLCVFAVERSIVDGSILQAVVKQLAQGSKDKFIALLAGVSVKESTMQALLVFI